MYIELFNTKDDRPLGSAIMSVYKLLIDLKLLILCLRNYNRPKKFLLIYRKANRVLGNYLCLYVT
jgi:hypothetical protein